MTARDANDIALERGPDGLRAAFDRASNGTEPPSRFRLVPFGEIRSATGRSHLIKGLIVRTGIVVIYGPPKSGKSFFTTDLLLHAALDWKYRGRPVTKGIVVYLACEGHAGFPARIEAFRQRFLAENTAGEVPFYYIAANLDLVADKGALIQAIRAQIGPASPNAVCIDTLNRSLNGSESKDEDMGKYLRAAGAIVEAFNCVVIVVHHSGIDASRPRGHTSLTGAADVQIRVERDTADNVVATVEWMKDGAEGEQIVSRLEMVEIGTNEDGDPITSCVIVPSTEEANVSRTRVTGAAKLALDLLCTALDEAGEDSQGTGRIPSGSRTIHVNLWRQYCYAGTVAESDKPDAKQKAFVRASKRLQEQGAIGIWNDRVWLTGHARQ